MKPFARRSVVYIFTPTPAGRESIELIGAGCMDKLEIADVGDYLHPEVRFSGSGGPDCVITNMAAMGFDADRRRMYLRGCFQGVDQKDVLDNMGFVVDTSRAEAVPPPSTEEVEILREKCEPQRLILD